MEFHPYSKAEQLGKHQKPLDKPKYKERRPKKKNHLKTEVLKGRRVPDKKTRGKISKTDYREAIMQHGPYCWVCGTSRDVEAHHVRFRSNSGRGGWRNVRFLCAAHHRGLFSPHRNDKLRKKLEELHEALYGQYYWCDRFDLFKLGLTSNTTKESFESYMKKQGVKASDSASNHS